MLDEYGGQLLDQHLRRNGIRRMDAAERLNVSRVTLWNWIKRKSKPLEPVRRDIAAFTGGEVPESSWGAQLDKRQPLEAE